MITIPIDGKLQTALAAVHETAILRAEDGTVLGYFAPAGFPAAQGLAQVLTRIDVDELRRRQASTATWHTTAQVLERLRDVPPR
jgi:hypothetical protein